MVRSLAEFFAIAHRLEREAADSYAALAAHARNENLSDLADLFDRLADEEREHERQVICWAKRVDGAAPDPTGVKWKLPGTFDDEAAGELAVSRTGSPYRILSMAVRNEERAFVFWSYVAAEAPSDTVRTAAEAMAVQELHHVSLLRRARRQAYHAERRQRPPEASMSLADRLAENARLEHELALHLNDLAGQLEGEDHTRAVEYARRSIATAGELGRGASGSDKPATHADLLPTAERLVDNYLDIAESSRNETVTLRAQEHALVAIERLAWLRDLKAVGRR